MRRRADIVGRPTTRSRLRRFARDVGGTTAVEFGLIAIPFLGLLCATFDTGLAFFAERNLDAAAQTAARQIRTGAVQAAGVVKVSDFVSTYICPTKGSLLSSFIDCTKLIVDVRTSTTMTGNDLSNDFYKAGSSNPNQFCLGAPHTVTIVRVAYPMPWYMPVVTTGGIAQTAGLVNDVPNNPGWKLLLVSASAVRTEPYLASMYSTYQAAKGC